MVVRKTKKPTTTTGTNATIDQYFKVKAPTSAPTRNVDENFNSQPVEDDMKPLLTPERKIEKISKQIKRKPLAEISEPSCTTAPFSMAIPKKPSKPAFVVLRDEDIDKGVTEAQQLTTDAPKDTIVTTAAATTTTQPDSLWTQSIPIGNTYNSQSSITSSPVNVFTQESLLPHPQKLDDGKKVDNNNKDNNNNGDDSDDDGIGFRIDELDDTDEDDDDDNVDPFFDDLDDPFIKKTNKRRIPYSTTFSNKRQCPFSVPSGLNKSNSSGNRMIRNKSIFDENENDEDDEDDDDLFPADSLLFTSDNNSSKSDSVTTNSTRVDSTTTDDQEKSNNHPTSPLNKVSIGSLKEIASSPVIEYSISESMTFPIEYHDDDDDDGDDSNSDDKKESNANDLQEHDNTNDTLVDNNNNKNKKIVNENDDEKENKINNDNLPSSPPILKEKIRSTVSSPTKSTIISPISKSPLRSAYSSPTKSPFKSVLSSPSKTPLSSTSTNISQLSTLPISLPSDSSLDIHVAYPNPRGKSILEKFDISDN